jgi:hypothetical protein
MQACVAVSDFGVSRITTIRSTDRGRARHARA